MQELLPTLEIKPQRNQLATSALHHRYKKWSTRINKLTEKNPTKPVQSDITFYLQKQFILLEQESK